MKDMTIRQGEWVLVDADTEQPVAANVIRLDFRGDPMVLQGGTPPRHAASTGRVHTDQGEFFPSVLGLKWVM